MTMLANRTETRVMTLADYEARIHLYKEQIGVGYIGIGRTLLEAKEAKVVPHGQWEAWVTETTGLTPRQAQRCMQAATEIKDGTAMARLEMSKAMLLLSSGLDSDQQEAIAGRAAEDGATVKELKEEIRQTKLKLVQETGAAAEIRNALRKAEEERDGLEQQMKAQMESYRERLEEARSDAYQAGINCGKLDGDERIRKQAAEIRQLRTDLETNRQQRQSLKAQLENAQQTTVQMRRKATAAEEDRENAYKAGLAAGMPTDYDQLKKDRDMILAAAEDAEKRAADAEAELEALRAGRDPSAKPAAVTLGAAMGAFFGECELLPWHPADLQADRGPILGLVSDMEDWCRRMRAALEVQADGEGAVE